MMDFIVWNFAYGKITIYNVTFFLPVQTLTGPSDVVSFVFPIYFISIFL